MCTPDHPTPKQTMNSTNNNEICYISDVSRNDGRSGIIVNHSIFDVSRSDGRSSIKVNHSISPVSRSDGRVGISASCFEAGPVEAVGRLPSPSDPPASTVTNESQTRSRIIPILDYSCCLCSYRSASAIGLGQHMRHRHVQEYNARKAAKVTSRRHSQWTNEEDDVLLDTANDI